MGEYANAGGVRTHYEVEGAGDPVLLLHGGGVGAESWACQTPTLAEHYRVYVPERRGHGHTPDVEGPLTTEAMAGDTIAFLESLQIGSARLVGWSDGVLVAVRVALRRPDLVRKLVLIGQYLTRDGATAAAKEFIDISAATLAEMLGASYASTSPDGPDHVLVFFEKLSTMWREEPDIDLSVLSALAMPTLVLQGDDDAVRIEHSVAVARALPDAQLAVLPGASHALPLERPGLLNQILLDFLADEQPAKFLPLGDLTAGR